MGPRHSTDLGSRGVLLGHFWLIFSIFGLSNLYSKCCVEKCGKKCENAGFWLPKTLPEPSKNAIKTEVPKNMQCLIDFCSISFIFCIFDFLKIVIFPKGNHYFQGFRSKRIFVIFAYFSFKKHSKNPPKTKPATVKNPCQKCVVF